ncbi:MAG: hypothetical protein IJG24_02345, partial [Selenomonadaceae bacterium]|nr:hypothetical protein [Selenomonadaceae bacterium]
YNGKQYYCASDVAKILGVSKKTVCQWNNELWHGAQQFTADLKTHDGVYLYTVERVEQIKSVYHPKWMRGGYEPSPAEDDAQIDKPDDDATNARIRDDIKRAHTNLQNLSFADSRGLDVKTLRRFGFGYLKAWRHPKTPNAQPTSRIIAPLGDGHDAYNAILTPSERKRVEPQRKRGKPPKWTEKCLTAGSKLVFNPDDLKKSIVVVTEGEIDCASLWQAAQHGKKPNPSDDANSAGFVALGGAGQYANLINCLKASPTKPKVIVLFDSDDHRTDDKSPGRERAEELRKKLWDIGVVAVKEFLDDVMSDDDKRAVGGKIDPNAILQAQGDGKLYWIFASVVKKAREDFKQAEYEMEQFKEAREADKRDDRRPRDLSPEIDALIARIKDEVPISRLVEKGYLQHSEKGGSHPDGYCCPWCGSGTGKNKTGALKIFDGGADPHVVCHACKKGGNVITTFAQVKNLPTTGKEFFSTLREMCDEFNVKYAPSIFDKQPSRTRLAELQARPPSPARDAAIIKEIRDACTWSRDKHGKPTTIKATSANLNLIFTEDPNLRGLIGYDEFQAADVFLRQPPWRKDNVVKKPLEDRDDGLLAFYLRENYAELHSRELIYEATIAHSQKHAFHDVKEYFYHLPRWDGKPRAETLFVDFLRVKDTPFAREVTRKWLLGAVARIFRPGCRFQFALTLQGRQGVGKSYILERLGGAWHGVLNDSVDDPHAIDAIQAMWICELKEFKATRKADVNSLKSFIDTSADTRRASYGRRATKVPRHNANAITVNDKQFLSDKTGNRRFPILESQSAAGDYIEGLTDEFIAQVWAEVFTWYNALTADDTDRDNRKVDKALELSRDAQQQVEAVAEKFMRDDGLANEIQGYLDTPIPAQVIWHTLTKEERRTFMTQGSLRVGGGEAELTTRIRNRKWNRSGIDADVIELHRVLSCGNEGKNYNGDPDAKAIYIYGTELRQHVSVSEILAEAFSRGDKRANNYSVGEVMDAMSDWKLGERLRGADPQYPDVRKPYLRDKPIDDEPTHDTQP